MKKSIKKGINRNPFNEKLIHRYFMETLYLGTVQEKRSLLPQELRNKASKINLVVPEDSYIYKGYRADFTIFFKGDNSGIPVEIKWHSKYFNKPNQLSALKRKNGFLVSFDQSEIDDDEHVKIDEQHFRDWLLKRCSVLWREAFSEMVINRKGGRTWLIVLRGWAKNNFHNMLEECKSKKTKFWAFRNAPRVMENILNIMPGDELIFLMLKTHGNEGRKMMPGSKNKVDLEEIYYAEVLNPYYMVLSGQQATFFERRERLPINNRIWPHFIDFKVNKSFPFNEPVSLDRAKFSKEFRRGLATSYNRGGGSPVLASEVDADQLKGEIRLLIEKKINSK